MPNPSTPAERFAALILELSVGLNTRHLVGLLAQPLVLLILGRLRGITQRFARLAARIATGRSFPRRSAALRPIEATPPDRKPRRPDPLPKNSGWLFGLAQEAAAGAASQLRFLLVDPEMAALLAAAPASFRRPLRSLCRMLAVETPPVLALPPRPKRSIAPKERPPRPVPERPKRPSGVRYVGGLRYPSPFPNLV